MTQRRQHRFGCDEVCVLSLPSPPVPPVPPLPRAFVSLRHASIGLCVWCECISVWSSELDSSSTAVADTAAMSSDLAAFSGV